MEATLLLVNPAELPRGLEEQLTAKGAFVETATTEQLEPAVIAVAPDLVVAPSTAELDHVLAVLGRQDPVTPLVLVADWKEHRELRARRERVIGALLSRGTPAALLATRIAEFGERAARGETLQRTPSLAPRTSAAPTGSPTNPAGAPLAQRSAPVPVTSPAPEPVREPAPVPEPVALPVESPVTPTVATAASPAPDVPEPALPETAVPEPARAVPAERPAAERPAAERPAAERPPVEERSTASHGESEHTSERLSLTFSQRPLPPLRLGLVDTDLTRAGAVADELRRRGVTTQLLAPDLDATRWHLLRRLSPHGLVIDEHGLAGQADWLEALRLDPFLRHVPLLVVPLARVFRESSGDADASLLVPLLLSLGAEEAALRDRIAPGREIELRLDQIGALRLLEVLGDRRQPTRLECVEGDTRLRWELHNGRAHTARLGAGVEPGSDGADVLPAEEALDWLLAHPECRVRAVEPTDLGSPSDSGVPIEELLAGATSREVIPAPPPPPRRSLRPPRGEPVAAIPAAPKESLEVRLRSGVLEAKRTWSRLGAWIVPRWRGLPPPRRYAALGLGALLLVAPLVAALTGGTSTESATATVRAAQPAEQEAAPPRDPAPSAKKERSSPPTPPSAQPSASPKPAEGNHHLFQVSPDTRLSPCDESVSVAGESRTMASRYLQRARKQLVAGNVEEARLLMCKAARLEPASPASEGLAQLYLTDRSLENAKHWAEVALRHDPESRTTLELLGDIASQRGDVAEARKLWLQTMQLTGDETATIEAVSRSQTRAAQRAVRSSDLPRAERFFRRAVTLDPNNGPAAAGLAQVLFDLEQREAAERWARRALEVDPTSVKHLGDELRELVE